MSDSSGLEGKDRLVCLDTGIEGTEQAGRPDQTDQADHADPTSPVFPVFGHSVGRCRNGISSCLCVHSAKPMDWLERRSRRTSLAIGVRLVGLQTSESITFSRPVVVRRGVAVPATYTVFVVPLVSGNEVGNHSRLLRRHTDRGLSLVFIGCCRLQTGRLSEGDNVRLSLYLFRCLCVSACVFVCLCVCV